MFIVTEYAALMHGAISLQDEKSYWSVKLRIFFYPSVLGFVLGPQKDHLIETIPMNTTIYILVEKQEN